MPVAFTSTEGHEESKPSGPPAAKQEDTPPEPSQAAAESAASEAAAAAVHPLRVYCEYLSYLFRKPPMPDGQEQLEVGYRDYLQVTCPLP